MSANQSPINQIAVALKDERKRLGLSLAEVARRANIAKSTLSQLENAIGNPSIETLWAICLVLDIPVSRLLESPLQQTKVIRKGQGVSVSSDSNGYQASLLSASPPNVRRDIYWIDVQPDQPHYSEPHNAGVIEYVIITKGQAKLGLLSEVYQLNEGDCICYAGDKPHVFEALHQAASAVLISEYRQ